MKNKYLEKKISVNSSDSADFCSKNMQLEYYLIESDLKDPEMNGVKAFGIEIIKITDNKSIEAQSVYNFSCCKEIAMDTINKFASNIVTPCSMYSILDDMIGN